MPITYWVNKLPMMGVFVLLFWAGFSFAYAEIELTPVNRKEGMLWLSMTDRTEFKVAPFADRDTVLYDRNRRAVDGAEFISLFRISPSNPNKPMGFCGAGNEVWLHVYRVAGVTLTEVINTVISSCLHSISMASQNSGTDTQDDDFSSVRWSSSGFSIDWFERVDAAGNSLKRSDFFLHEGIFLQQEIFNKTDRRAPTTDQ